MYNTGYNSSRPKGKDAFVQRHADSIALSNRGIEDGFEATVSTERFGDSARVAVLCPQIDGFEVLDIG